MVNQLSEKEESMAVPGFQKTMIPILMALQEKGGKASIEELDEEAIKIMELPKEVTQVLHKGSNSKSEISYRMAWARSYLKKYGLIENESRGIWSFAEKFDGNIDAIDADEVVRSVRDKNGTYEEAMQTFTKPESALAFENMVVFLLLDLAGREGKSAFHVVFDQGYEGFDMVFPEGLEEVKEEIRCVIKFINPEKQSVSVVCGEMALKFNECSQDARYLLVVNTAVPKDVRGKFGSNVMVWDKGDLEERADPEASYAQYFINPKQAFIEDIIVSDNACGQNSKERDWYIKQIKDAFTKEDLVLCLGAGVSKDGGIPLWEVLIKKLHIYMLNQLTKGTELNIEEQKMVRELARNNKMGSPLMQMRYIKAAFQDEEYYRLVHVALYEQGVNTDTELLNAIARISTPQRQYCGVKNIISYNFDDLLERKLEQKDIRYHVISCDEDRQMADKLNIYHVHGYLPSEHEKRTKNPNLIFSEEDYHRVYRDSYSWSNLVQLSALRENTCLFIGSSLTDPNLRRLLDASSRKGEEARHFAFLKRDEIKNEIENNAGDKNVKRKAGKGVLEIYQKIDDNIRTACYRELGLNIIWIDKYEEIPDILNDLSG